MLVSCVITTKNEESVLANLLKSIKDQSYKDIETIIVDNNSTDKTIEIAGKYTKKVFNKGPERSTQRNFGVEKANGEWVLILDADMILTKNVIKSCASIIKGGNFGALIVPEKSFGKGFWVKFKIFEREFYEGEESIEAARMFDRKVFKKFNGYDTAITGPEDYDLPLRMKKRGIKIGRSRSYILHNEKKFSPIKSAKKKFYYASHAQVYLERHPEMAIKQGNLLFRTVFVKKWKKLVSYPFLSLGMFVVRMVEMTGALSGIIYSGIIQKVKMRK